MGMLIMVKVLLMLVEKVVCKSLLWDTRWTSTKSSIYLCIPLASIMSITDQTVIKMLKYLGIIFRNHLSLSLIKENSWRNLTFHMILIASCTILRMPFQIIKKEMEMMEKPSSLWLVLKDFIA